jgi:hypothetical protein
MTDAGSYSQLYASLKQFQVLELKPQAKEITDHLNKHLVKPHWGPNVKIVIDLPALDDPDQHRQEYDTDKGILTVNQRHAMRGRDPIGEEGDVPEQIYLAKMQADLQAQQQQAQQAQQQPQQPGQPEQSPGGDQPPGDESDPFVDLLAELDQPSPGSESQGSLPPRQKGFSFASQLERILAEETGMATL